MTKLSRVVPSFIAKSARQNRTCEEESREESVKPNLDQKHGWQAKRSLDSELYRNVELEVWEDSKNGSVAYLSVVNLKLMVWCRAVNKPVPSIQRVELRDQIVGSELNHTQGKNETRLVNFPPALYFLNT